MSAETAEAISAVREHMNRLRGRLFGAVEAVGLPEKQENAIKGLIRQTSYDAQADLESLLRRASAEADAASHTDPAGRHVRASNGSVGGGNFRA